MFRMPQPIEILFFYDGPLMFTAIHPGTNELIWVSMVDDFYDEKRMVWMVIKPFQDNLDKLKNNDISIYDFIHTQSHCWFWEENYYSSDIVESGPILLSSVRKDYFPKEKVFLKGSKS